MKHIAHRFVVGFVVSLAAVIVAFGAPPELKLSADKPTPKACELVTVKAETAAKTVRLKVTGDAQSFADSNGRTVAVVPKSGRVTVIGVAASETGELSQIVELVLADTTPPKPDEVVWSAAKLWIVIVEETGLAAAERGQLFTNAELVARITDKGHRYRIVDQDVIGADGKPPADIVKYLTEAKVAKLPRLFLVDGDGGVRFRGDAPKTAKDLIAILAKHGG